MAPTAPDLFARLDELEKELESFAADASRDEIARLKLLDIMRKAVARVETPSEVIRIMYMGVSSSLWPILCFHLNSLLSVASAECGPESFSGDGFGKGPR